VTRFLRIGLAVVTLLSAGVLLWRTAVRPAPVPAEARLDALQREASVAWHPNDAVLIEAASTADAWAALGYAHGFKRPWAVSLWRQTALGRLAEWFGPGLLPLDRHARRLGLARHAREAYDRLAPAQQRLLQAYVNGLNAALAAERPRQDDALVLLSKTPRAWEAWEPLAVERLFAWLFTPRLSPSAAAPHAAHDFVNTDARFRRWLHLHGFERSFFWAGRTSPADTARTAFVARVVTGASALPVFQEATVRTGSGMPLTLATLPGSPVVLGGAGGGRAWGWLPHSPVRLVQRPDTIPTEWSERLETRDGHETLITVHRRGATLPFTPGNDTTWALAWPGLSPSTDLGQWQHLRPPPDSTELALLSGQGLAAHPDGHLRVYGTPPVQVRLARGGRFVGTSPWAARQASALRSLPRRVAAAPSAWTRRDSSAWASQTMRGRLAALAPVVDTTASKTLQDAYAYLRNWTLRFSASSIGAAIFERWMQQYQQDVGRMPSARALGVRDSTFFAAHRLRLAFVDAVRDLRRTQGPDLRQWRWERVLPGTCRFPVWSADSLVAQDLSAMATTHFAPVRCRWEGHPSALSGGASRLAPVWPAPSPAGWTGWTDPDRQSLTVRRFRFAPSGFLARSLSAPAAFKTQRLSHASADHVTRLRPVLRPVTPASPRSSSP
jgi:hypothetical protein